MKSLKQTFSFNQRAVISGVIIIIVSISLAGGMPSPDGFFSSFSNLIDFDRVPSIEVKLTPKGISVSTGPSRSELYWTIGLCVGGAVVGVTLLVSLIFLCYHCHNKRMRGRSDSRTVTIGMTPSRIRGNIFQTSQQESTSFVPLHQTLREPIRTNNHHQTVSNNNDVNSPNTNFINV